MNPPVPLEFQSMPTPTFPFGSWYGLCYSRGSVSWGTVEDMAEKEKVILVYKILVEPLIGQCCPYMTLLKG